MSLFNVPQYFITFLKLLLSYNINVSKKQDEIINHNSNERQKTKFIPFVYPGKSTT